MKEKMTGNKICIKCTKIIDKKEEYCSLNTYKNDKIIETKWFHLRCYIEWFNKKVEERMAYFVNKGFNLLGGYLENGKSIIS